jgi:predicted DNA-binding transcriptional regulator YafY
MELFYGGGILAKGDRLARLLKMIVTIQNTPGLTAEELARECGVSQRQCFRDLEVLGNAELPIYNDHGYRFMDRFSFKNIALTLEEALSLIYGL